MEPSLKALDFAGNNGFREFSFLAAVRDVARHGLLQIINVVGEDAVELPHLGRNVAWYSDIDEEHRPVLAARQELLSMFAAEDGVWRAGRSDDDVGAIAGVIQVVELDGLPFELLRQADGPLIRPIGHEDGS